jgi:hypothetical protein
MLEHAEVSIQEAAKLSESGLTGIFCTGRGEREFTTRRAGNAQPEVQAEQIVTLLRQIEVGIANGKTSPQICKEAEITVQSAICPLAKRNKSCSPCTSADSSLQSHCTVLG